MRARMTPNLKAALIARATVGSWWIARTEKHGNARVAVEPRQVLAIKAGVEGPVYQLSASSRSTRKVWSSQRTLLHGYDPCDPPALNGAVSRIPSTRALIREEVDAVLSERLDKRNSGALRALIREECLAAIREAFGESRVS